MSQKFNIDDLKNQNRVLANRGNTLVVVLDNPDMMAGGACHQYAVISNEGDLLLELNFQHGPVKETGINGAQHGDLLEIIGHRLDCFQCGDFASSINEVTNGFVRAALSSEDTRTRRRNLAGVEGTNTKARGVES